MCVIFAQALRVAKKGTFVMRKTVIIFVASLLLLGCVGKKAGVNRSGGPFSDRHLKNVTQLTFDGGPWFSPDDKKIVWRAWHPETKEELARWRESMEKDYIVSTPLDLWVMDADGSNKARLTQNGATNWSPSWHPDGRRIIFSSNMDDYRKDIRRFGHNFELYLINVDGTGLERITFNTLFDSFPMFSHDGKKLVFASNRNPAKPRATDIFIGEWVE